jgi:hypothetical protein
MKAFLSPSFDRPAVLPSCRPAVLPSCHPAILSSCHPAIRSSCRCAPCHPVLSLKLWLSILVVECRFIVRVAPPLQLRPRACACKCARTRKCARIPKCACKRCTQGPGNTGILNVKPIFKSSEWDTFSIHPFCFISTKFISTLSLKSLFS